MCGTRSSIRLLTIFQTCSIGLMYREHAGHSVRMISSLKGRIYQVNTIWPTIAIHLYKVIYNFCSVRESIKSADLIAILLTGQISIPNQRCAHQQSIDYHSLITKLATSLHKRRTVSSSIFPSDENKSIININSKIRLIRENNIPPSPCKLHSVLLLT